MPRQPVSPSPRRPVFAENRLEAQWNGASVFASRVHDGSARSTRSRPDPRGAREFRRKVMRKTMKRFVATLLAAITVAAPATARADIMDLTKYCSSYDQVESNSTGGDYVGGRLVYESMGSV